MTVFVPQLRLIPQLDDVYDLRAATPVPNSCYFAGPARRETPPGVVVTPETEAVTLEVRRRGDVCLPFVKTVYHFLPGLVLGPETGKTHVTAFVVFEGEVKGSASIYPGGERALYSGPPEGCFPSEDWYAWDNQQPGAERGLYVTGIVETPTPGYRVTLEAGASIPVPRQFPLILKVVPLPGVWPAVVTRYPVRFEKVPYSGDDETVAIYQGDCEPIVVEIEVVH